MSQMIKWVYKIVSSSSHCTFYNNREAWHSNPATSSKPRMRVVLPTADNHCRHKPHITKVYLLISSHRVAGCLVAEPIKKAHRLISNSNEESDVTTTKDGKLTPMILQFGNISFQREFRRKNWLPKNERKSEDTLLGAIVCEKDAVSAVCGIRAIWVAPSNRRKHVATRLLEAARKSFCSDLILEHNQLAFSQPTNAGKLLANSYTNTRFFLVYYTTNLLEAIYIPNLEFITCKLYQESLF
ncbi:putative acyl-CoA N-acyltransferase, N-acetyltransferase ESCO, acetyl-transferase [Helianthus debilis subsp. tardiflorus]